ncbi:hypothetical protein NVP1293O_40 [Vibrio phage 1.293.O._10N.261.52.E1]|nr:hypothetical protein NVP1293O_40 [Vibrio phage 1.293.O._10N.261.52.E1]
MEENNPMLDMLEEISDEMMETSWRNELGINDGISPVQEAEDFDRLFGLPDFEMEEDELLINRGE